MPTERRGRIQIKQGQLKNPLNHGPRSGNGFCLPAFDAPTRKPFTMHKLKALVSVSDKTGLAPFVRRLAELGFEILSTGGTAAHLREAGIEVTDISDYTGFPELFGGRVKTLHPRVHGGILQRRGHDKDQSEAAENDVPPIDMLIVNLYPFQQTIQRHDVTLAEAIEQIDVGGPTLLRAAAKNYQAVTVLTDPVDYPVVLAELEQSIEAAKATDKEHLPIPQTSLKTRERLAISVFHKTAEYDSSIATYLNKAQETHSSFGLRLPMAECLRYGENPHQKATLYGNFYDSFQQLHGKELSYTNVLDIASAAALVHEFQRPTVAILKHTNPCGVGVANAGEDLRDAWDKAFETDRQAPFGGVIVVNRPLPLNLARVISEIFTDIIIAPDFEPEARALFQKKKNLRLIKMLPGFEPTLTDSVIHSVPGGVVVMDPDPVALGLDHLEERVVTERPPTADELTAMRFAWRVVKHVKSNAIVFATSDRTLGIGAGQMSRVDACRIAVWKAKEAGLDLTGSVVASDAMFPFPDGLLAAADAGAAAAIQPGGSMRDEQVIAAANERGMSMCFTGHRHFYH